MRTIVSILYFSFLIFYFSFSISSVSAITVGMDGLPYYDSAQFTQEESVAIKMLTDADILLGNDDGTFKTRSNLNRAEFMTIAMRIVPDDMWTGNMNCFSDVVQNSWYAYAVCKAKALGIVRGNVVLNVWPDEWLFEPERSVRYEEAVKVLIGVFNISIDEQETNDEYWYLPYIQKSNALGLVIKGLKPGYFLSRGAMAILTSKFYAYSNGNLDELLSEMQGDVFSSSSFPSVYTSSYSSGSAYKSSTVSNSSSSITYDQYGSVSLESNFLLLGEVTPVLASASAFSNTEPINVNDVLITLDSSVQSINSFLVYDENQKYLGQATLDSSFSGGKTYKLSVRNLDIQFLKREEYSFYVRARLKDAFNGGISGEIVEVAFLGINGTGEWSSSNYSSYSNDTFPTFQTTRSIITSIENADYTNSALFPGTNQIIGSFRFKGLTSDGQADLRVTDLIFGVASVGGVSVSGIRLGSDGTSDTMDCSIVGSAITCANIDPMYGSFEDNDRVLILFGDITISDSSINRSLTVSLNQAGSTGFAGAITWTDGDSSFSWVQLGSPVSRGTRYE